MRGQALDGLDEGGRLLGQIRTTTDAILAEEERLDNDRMARLHNSTVRQAWTLIAGGIAFLGTLLALGFVFLNGVIRRLAVLRENAHRFAEGKGLVAPLSGSDEIAEVDRAFHEMASSLDQQKQENEMFVYSVSHDLRSPLINLQGFSEELSRSYREASRPPAPRGYSAGRSRRRPEAHDGKHRGFDTITFKRQWAGWPESSMRSFGCRGRARRVSVADRWILQPVIRKIVDALHDTIDTRKAEIVVKSCRRRGATRPRSNRFSPT